MILTALSALHCFAPGPCWGSSQTPFVSSHSGSSPRGDQHVAL